ncbi:MAG: hypothetical protein FD129_150 [bacterium]|nr:MAG: hypothetical protein FD129_150 [bacterium]
MIRTRRGGLAATLLTLTLSVLVAACGEDDNDNAPPPVEGVVPDFSLLDVNPNSSTYNTGISPRDYRERISAWYFGSST